MIKICVFADIHYCDEIPNWPVKRKLVEYAEDLTNKLIDKINNEIKPDIVIYLGDLIQSLNDKEKDIKNIKHVLSIFKRINKPFYTLIGNHELKEFSSNREVLDIIGYQDSSFSIDIDNYHLIFLNTDVNENDKEFRTQYISIEDLKWLEKDLDNNNDKKTLIFSHFGIAEDKSIKDNFWCYTENGENLMLRNRNEFKRIIKGKNVLGVFVGHQHWTKRIEEDGINYYIVGSLTENINNDGIPDGVYFIVEIDNNSVKIDENHLTIE